MSNIQPASSPLSSLMDNRVNCWSVMMETTVRTYLTLADVAYQQRGGIKHQREALRSTSGRRIRARMIDDIKKGAVLPPIVIGIVATKDFVSATHGSTTNDLLSMISERFKEEIAIIDGMQRTTALLDAAEGDPQVFAKPIRLELWIAETTDSLIYRMLILNTGQVPWNLKHQLQVVYEPLIKEIKNRVNFPRFLAAGDRRWHGGEFNPESLVECYIAFGLRRIEVDTQENLADEFSRLDIAEALTSRKYNEYFYHVIQIMVNIDIAFSKFDSEGERELSDEDGSLKIKQNFVRGKNIFDPQPARIGFVVAAAVNILGRIGMDKTDSESSVASSNLIASCWNLVHRLSSYNRDEHRDFLALDILRERLGRRSASSAVGRWERTFFETAFKTLIELNMNVPSMEVCWRA